MRFKLELSVIKEAYGNILPINYQYEMSAVIYKILAQADMKYATWLHKNGFIRDKKLFKLFTFSGLNIPRRSIDKENERIIIQCNTVYWQISFSPEASTDKFIQGLFMNRSIELGDSKSKVLFNVVNIEMENEPDLSQTLQFEALSPICISIGTERRIDKYLSPSDENAGEYIITSLINRYEAFYNKEYTGNRSYFFNVLDTPKPKLIKIKADTPQQTKIKGYLCKFQLKADENLMRLMYSSGVGVKGSLGFGMVKVI